MAKADIRIVSHAGLSNVPTLTWQTEAAATAIYAGEPVKLKAAGSPYVIPLADADLTIGTDTAVGIAASDSDHTALADGTVDVYLPLTGVVYASKAKDSTLVDTAAEILAMQGDRKVLDLTTGVYTMDTAAVDGANNAFYIVGGNPVAKEVYFTIRTDATYLSA